VSLLNCVPEMLDAIVETAFIQGKMEVMAPAGRAVWSDRRALYPWAVRNCQIHSQEPP